MGMAIIPYHPSPLKRKKMFALRIIQTILLTPVLYLANVAVLMFAGIAAKQADEHGRLPSHFQWMETHDNLGWSGPLSEPTTKAIYKEKGPVAGLTAWLRRNKAYTFRKKTLGFKYDRDNFLVSDERGNVGPFYWTFLVTNKEYFQLQPEIFLKGIGGIYLNIGWKLTNTDNNVKGTFMGITPRVRKRDAYI